MKHIALVEHEKGGRVFLFDNDLGLKDGDSVICKTRYGEKIGTVVAVIIIRTEAIMDGLIRATGASLPLAPILRKYVKPVITSIDEIPQHLVEQIQRQCCDKIMSKIAYQAPVGKSPYPFEH